MLQGNKRQQPSKPWHAILATTPPGGDVADVMDLDYMGQWEGTSAAAILAEIPFSPMKTPEKIRKTPTRRKKSGNRGDSYAKDPRSPAIPDSPFSAFATTLSPLMTMQPSGSAPNSLSSTPNWGIDMGSPFASDMEANVARRRWISRGCLAPASQHWQSSEPAITKMVQLKVIRKIPSCNAWIFKKNHWQKNEISDHARRRYIARTYADGYNGNTRCWAINPVSRQHLPGLGTVAETFDSNQLFTAGQFDQDPTNIGRSTPITPRTKRWRCIELNEKL